MSEITKAPWTAEQCVLLNRRQANNSLHPYTCGGCSPSNTLVAVPEGWRCSRCDYQQDWAHASDVAGVFDPSAELAALRAENERLNAEKRAVWHAARPLVTAQAISLVGTSLDSNHPPQNMVQAISAAVGNMPDGAKRADERNATLRQRVVELEKALAFYANDQNYVSGKPMTPQQIEAMKGFATAMDADGGLCARAALSQPRPAAEGGDGPKQIPCLRNHVDGQTCPCCNNTGWFTPNQNVTVALRDAAAAFGGDDESPSAGQQEGGNNA